MSKPAPSPTECRMSDNDLEATRTYLDPPSASPGPASRAGRRAMTGRDWMEVILMLLALFGGFCGGRLYEGSRYR